MKIIFSVVFERQTKRWPVRSQAFQSWRVDEVHLRHLQNGSIVEDTREAYFCDGGEVRDICNKSVKTGI